MFRSIIYSPLENDNKLIIKECCKIFCNYVANVCIQISKIILIIISIGFILCNVYVIGLLYRNIDSGEWNYSITENIGSGLLIIYLTCIIIIILWIFIQHIVECVKKCWIQAKDQINHQYDMPPV